MYTRSLLGLFLTALPALAQAPLALLGAAPSGAPEADIFVLPSQLPWLGAPPGGALTYEDAVRAAVAGDRADPRPEPGRVDPARITAADPSWAGG